MRIHWMTFDDRYRYDPLEGRWTSAWRWGMWKGMRGGMKGEMRGGGRGGGYVDPPCGIFDSFDHPDRCRGDAPKKPMLPIVPIKWRSSTATIIAHDTKAIDDLILFSYLSPLAQKYYHGPSDLTGRIIDLVI